MTGPNTDDALFEHDDYENDDPLDEESEDVSDDYGADDDNPPRICGNLFDGN